MKSAITWVKQSAENHPWMWKLGSIPVVFSAVLLAFALLPSPGVSTDPPDEQDAYVACKDFVAGRLKAPATAEFGDQFRFKGESPRWTVYGTVDAENSFGARLRLNWTCVVKLDGAWQLELLTGLN